MAICRLCKIEINKEKDDWIMPVRNYYYHRNCYKDWKEAEHVNDEDYIELNYDFIARDLKVKYNYHVCEAQRKKFIKDNKMTNKGILFALKYFYEIKHGDWEKGYGGIGIIPFIYTESCAYWAAQERKSKGIIAEIEHQMREAQNRTKKTIVQQKVQPRKFTVDLSAIAEMEDE